MTRAATRFCVSVLIGSYLGMLGLVIYAAADRANAINDSARWNNEANVANAKLQQVSDACDIKIDGSAVCPAGTFVPLHRSGTVAP